jgi:hypothetical protein
MVVSWRKASIILLILLGTGSDAWAEGWLYFKPIRGELSIGFDGSWRRRDTGTSTYRTELEEKLRLDIAGDVVDRRILAFDVNLEPVFKQGWRDTGSSTDRLRTNYLNYSGRIRALNGLEASPVSLDADFGRLTIRTDSTLGSETDFVRDSAGASLNWHSTALPAQLSYNEHSLDEIFISAFGQPPTERRESQRRLNFRARNRKMELVLEGIEFDDRTLQDNDYESQDARLNNNFQWGKGSSLTSRLKYFNRVGFSPWLRSSISENLRLQHTESLFTTYGFNYERSERTTSSDTIKGDFALNHELYSNLTTSLNVLLLSTDSDDFQEDRTDTWLNFDYRKKFEGGPAVTANLGGGYREAARVGGQVDFSESPTVPPTGVVPLTQRFIVQSSIIVTAPGCNPCTEITDYLVEDAGNDFTQLRIPAGSRINIGDTITVDYVFVQPSLDFYSFPYQFGARLQYERFAFYHRTNMENQILVEGDPDALTDRRTHRTGVEWNWTRNRDRALLTAEHLYSDVADKVDSEFVFAQNLNLSLRPNALLDLRFSQSFLDSATGDVQAFYGDADITWVLRRGLSITPYVSAFHRSSDPGRDESYLEIGAIFDWRWRRLDFDAQYYHSSLDNDGVTEFEDRLQLTVKRKF